MIAARSADRRRWLETALPVIAATAVLVSIGLSVWASSAAGTLGYDYLSYDKAIRRFLMGGPLYDVAFDAPGPFGLFFYPPTFVLLVLPLALLTPNAAVWVVTLAMVACFVAAVAILPVSGTIRWVTLLLGALSWPLVDAIKLGQVGPLLLLAFAVGWRWIDRPWPLGVATALGTAIKLQPVVLFGWALLTGRRRAVVIGLVAFAVIALASTILVGPSAWADETGLLVRLSQPVTAAHIVTAGRLAFEAGMGETVSWLLQLIDWAAIAAVVLYVLGRGSHEASYLAVVTASQAISPILWDHYALMLLLPVAWLLQRRLWWAALIPLATSLPLIEVTPRVFYPLGYAITLVLIAWQGTAARRGAPNVEPVALHA